MNFPSKTLAVLQGHQGAVNCVKFSAGSGQYVLTGCNDRTIRLYNPQKVISDRGGPPDPKFGLVQSYSAHGYEVLDIAVADDNARFASVGGDRQVFLWDVTTGTTLRRWAGHGGKVNCVAFGGIDCSVAISGSFDATVRFWDCKSQSAKPIQILEDARDGVSSIHVVDYDIVTGSTDGRVRHYDMRTGLRNMHVLGAPVTSVMQTIDGNAILTSSLDSTIRLIDKENGQLLQQYRGHTNKEYRIRSSLGLADKVVVSGSENGQIFVWDLLEGSVQRTLSCHGGTVASSVCFNDKKGQWASAGGDGKVNIWGFG